MTKVQHRRASESVWQEANPVIPDGEIALIKRSTGYDAVIGDGETEFFDLIPVGGILTETEEEHMNVSLRNNEEISLAYIENLGISLEHYDSSPYFSMISFKTYDYPPTVSFENYENIRFSGASIEDGVFVPDVCMHYTLIFWKSDKMNCHVRGVYEE